MTKWLAACVALAACTNGPGVAGHWKTTDAWGDGNCNQDFTWYDTVRVTVGDATTVLADETHSCDDGGFDIAVDDGLTDLTVTVNVIAHQDQTFFEPPLTFTIPGPIHTHDDLGRLTLP